MQSFSDLYYRKVTSRNPKIFINNTLVQFMGDPHLGRNFNNRVSLEHRGFFESKQKELFVSLIQGDSEEVIIAGDLCDNFLIGLTWMSFISSELKKTKKDVYIIEGNHDSAKNTDRISSFKYLQAEFDSYHQVSLFENIRFVSQPEITKLSGVGLLPWDHTKTSIEQFELLPAKVTTVVTHLDSRSYGDDSRNVVPADYFLQQGIKLVINGHQHKPQTEMVENMIVYHIGSMMPYAHLEGLEGEAGFITLRPEQLGTADPELLKNSVVRLNLRADEKIPEGIDCLKLEVTRLSDEEIKSLEVSIEVDPSDLARLFKESMRAHEVSEKSQNEAWVVLINNQSIGD